MINLLLYALLYFSPAQSSTTVDIPVNLTIQASKTQLKAQIKITNSTLKTLYIPKFVFEKSYNPFQVSLNETSVLYLGFVAKRRAPSMKDYAVIKMGETKTFHSRMESRFDFKKGEHLYQLNFETGWMPPRETGDGNTYLFKSAPTTFKWKQ